MAIKYVPYYPDPVEGQAILDNFARTRRVLKYRDNDRIVETVKRGMPLYEMRETERVGENADGNLVIRGECVSACAFLKEQGIFIDLVYIDPPFASGADYAKKIYVRRNPLVAKAIAKAEEELDNDELRSFEETMYGDVWDKEKYLNWMYENLMAIKSVMSETASIYVHLDWHIGHYVKVLMDEIFGDNNFRNEIIWHYADYMQGNATNALPKKHDNIFFYSMSDDYFYERITIPLDKPVKRNQVIWDSKTKTLKVARDSQGKIVYEEFNEKFLDSVWDVGQTAVTRITSNEYLGYSTQKPIEVLRRIIEASSKEGMIVADFFGGSGVTSAVASKLGRRFITCDIGLNSIQVTRDRLYADGAQFTVLEIQDGVSLYRNPQQTMEKLKSLIVGLRNEDALDKFWEGAFQSTKDGLVPVYVPNLMDGTTRLLDERLMARILFEAMPDLPPNVKKIVVFYIDIEDRAAMERFIRENNDTEIEIELRDLKPVLAEVVVEDYAEFSIEQVQESLIPEYKVSVARFISDRVQQRIDKANDVEVATSIAKSRQPKLISISETGLELIEAVSVDCTNAEKDAPWLSAAEIKVDKFGYVTKNGVKTKEFWDGALRCEHKPLRVKIRNICGDESVWEVSKSL